MADFGKLDADFSVIRWGRFRSRKRSWTVHIKHFEGQPARVLRSDGSSFVLTSSGGFLLQSAGYSGPSAEPEAEYIRVISEPESIILDYGPAIGDLWVLVLSCSLSLQVIDPDFDLYDEIIQSRLAGDSDQDWRLRIFSDDGIYDWEGMIKLNQISTIDSNLFTLPVISLTAYDGTVQEGDKSSTAVYLAPTNAFHSVLRTLLAYTLLPLDIEYIISWTANNQTAGPIITRIRADDLSPLAKKLSRREALEFILSTFLCRVWQSFSRKWMIKQPWELGKTIASGSGGAYWQYTNVDDLPADETDEVVDIAINDSPLSLVRRDWVDDLSRFPEDIITKIDVDVDQTFDEGNTIIINADPRFESWADLATPYHYDVVQGNVLRDARGRTGNCAHLVPPAMARTLLRCRTFYFAPGNRFFDISFYWASDAIAGPGGSSVSLDYALIDLAHDRLNDKSRYWDGNDWTDAETILSTPAQTVEASGADPLTWHEITINVDTPYPVLGQLRLELYGDDAATPVNFYVDDLFIYPVDGDGEGLLSIESKNEFNTIDRDFVKQGSDISFARPINNFLIDPPGITEADYPIEILETAPSTYDQLGKISAGGSTYFDQGRLIYDVLTNESNEVIERLRGRARHLLPPETILTYLSKNWLFVSGKLYLIEEETLGEWITQPEF